jgi:hypothetical protein
MNEPGLVVSNSAIKLLPAPRRNLTLLAGVSAAPARRAGTERPAVLPELCWPEYLQEKSGKKRSRGLVCTAPLGLKY